MRKARWEAFFGIVIYIMLQFTVFDGDTTINAIMPESDIKINAGKETVLGYHLKKGDQSMQYPIVSPWPHTKSHSIFLQHAIVDDVKIESFEFYHMSQS